MITGICGFSIEEIDQRSKEILEEHNKIGVREKPPTFSGILEDQLRELENIAETLDNNLNTVGYCFNCGQSKLDRDDKCKQCGKQCQPAFNSFGDDLRITDKHLENYENKTEEEKEKAKQKNTKENIKELQKIKKKLFELSQKKDVQKRKQLNISNYTDVCSRIEKAITKILDTEFVIHKHNSRHTRPDIDRKLVKRLKQVFDNVNQGRTRKVVVKGKTPNVSRYIRAQSTPTKKIFNQNLQNKNPFTIYIMLDQSWSMGHNTAISAMLVNSFYESVKFNKKIKIKVVGFEGRTINYVERQSDLNIINYKGGGTPTSEALTYMKSIMYKDKGEKLFILVSDGEPNGIQCVDAIDPSIYIKTLINDMKYKKGINAFGILVGAGNFEDYSAIFGENFAQFDEFENAGELLIKIFSKYVAEYLKD